MEHFDHPFPAIVKFKGWGLNEKKGNVYGLEVENRDWEVWNFRLGRWTVTNSVKGFCDDKVSK